jgi:hypothetical protein
MYVAHCSNDCVPVAFTFEIQIAQEQVEVLSFYLLDGLLHIFGNRHCKPVA